MKVSSDMGSSVFISCPYLRCSGFLFYLGLLFSQTTRAKCGGRRDGKVPDSSSSSQSTVHDGEVTLIYLQSLATHQLASASHEQELQKVHSHQQEGHVYRGLKQHRLNADTAPAAGDYLDSQRSDLVDHI